MSPSDTSTRLQEMLLDAGLVVRITSARDLRITTSAGEEIDLRLVVTRRPPTPAEVRKHASGTAPDAVTAFVSPRTNDITRRLALDDPRLALFGLDDGTVIVRGDDLTVEKDDRPTGTERRRVSYALFALQRTLARTREPRFQADLARECGVSQMTVSKLLRADPLLAEKTEQGWIAHDPRALADRFLAEYPGPGGLSQLWYSIRPVVEQAERASTSGPRALLSGDSAADRLAPWRVPRTAVVYADRSLPLEAVGFAETDSREATLRVQVPMDETIWATATAWYPRGHTVDPLIAAWDLRRSGGPDADEAVEHLLSKAMTTWLR